MTVPLKQIQSLNKGEKFGVSFGKVNKPTIKTKTQIITYSYTSLILPAINS